MTKANMTETCPSCGRPVWHSHGGMGVGTKPDAEKHCVLRHGLACRVAATGYRHGIDEGIRVARKTVRLGGIPGYVRFVDWSDVDKAASEAKGVDHG